MIVFVHSHLAKRTSGHTESFLFLFLTHTYADAWQVAKLRKRREITF